MNAIGPHRDLAAKGRRVWALVVKETRQVARDPSSIAIGVVMPVILILLFGFGLSLDVKDVPLAVAAARRISPGAPWASTRPASRMAIRSQYSASCMKWVVTMTVTPCSARAVIRRQNARRASGSAPLVGSSRNRISGSCNSAAAIARRCL